MSNDTLTHRVVRLYVGGDVGALDGLYAPAAVADVNVPQWRYQLSGAKAIERAVLEDELGVLRRVVPSWRVGTTEDGLYLETEVRFQGDDGEHMWRSLHRFRAQEGWIVEHTIYCSGIWSPAAAAHPRGLDAGARFTRRRNVRVDTAGQVAI